MFSKNYNSMWVGQQRRRTIDVHGCTATSLAPKRGFLFLPLTYECQHNNAWWQHSNVKMRFSHQICLQFVRKWCYSLLTIFPHLWTAAAQKKNPIFRCLTFMISLLKTGVEIWNKLFNSGTEINCIKIATK